MSVFVLTTLVRAQTPQVINTVAGVGTSGYSGDGGPAASAGITYPFGVAYDEAGNIYVADGYNGRIRMVSASTGIMSTVAGGGSNYNIGTGIAATTAGLGTPSGVAIDGSGNIYICDMGTQLIYKVTASTGTITVVAGNALYGYAGDGGPATSASFASPTAIALDTAGNFYIADSGNNVVRKVNISTGTITTVVGTGTAGYSGDGGPAISATIQNPWGIAVDTTGNIYVSDTGNSSVRKVDASTGLISTVAGVGTHESGVSGEGGPATSAGLWYQSGIAVDGAGNLYIADGENQVIQKVSASTGVITIVAGTFETAGFSGDGGLATSALLYNPQAVAVSPSNNLAIADWANLRIRQVVPTPQIDLSGAHRRAITINHTKVPNTDQNNFPILIDASAFISGWTGTGYNIIFTSDPAGQHRLDHEIDTYNGKDEIGVFWVRIPTLSHTSDTTIYMFYGIPGITTSLENKAGVWSNGYLSVYHFGSNGLTDSGSAGYTLLGSTSGGAGTIYGGASFNGDPGTYLYRESVSAYPSGPSPVTLESWVRWVPGNSGDIVGYGANSGNGSRAAMGTDGTNLLMEFQNMGIVSPMPTDGNWHHLVGVYSGGALSTLSNQLYIDGNLLSSNLFSGTPAITTTEFKIGGTPTVTNCCALNGSVDEIRVSSVARSADWVATEYANQSSPSTFYSVGADGSSSVSMTLNCSPNPVLTGGSISCTAQAVGATSGTISVYLDGALQGSNVVNQSGSAVITVPPGGLTVGTHTITASYFLPNQTLSGTASQSISVTSSTQILPCIVM